MKKTFLITAITVAGFSLAACNEKPSQLEGTVTMLVSSEEISDDGTVTLTEYAWNADMAPAGEKQTVDNSLVYRDDNYSYSGTEITCRRTYYDNGAVEKTRKRVTNYNRSALSSWSSIRSLYVYEIDEQGEPLSPNPVERREEFYDSYGRITKVEYEENGTIVLKYDGYVYLSNSVKHDIWDYNTTPATRTVSTTTYITGVGGTMTESISITTLSGSQIEYTEFLYNGNYYYGYNKYNFTENGQRVLAEEQTDYMIVDDSTVTYTTIRYEDDGRTVLSNVKTTKKYNSVTVVITT